MSDERKEEKLELSLLAEMVENLTADIKDQAGNSQIQQKSITGVETILAHFKTNAPYDSVLMKHFVTVGIVPVVLLNKTAYASMSREGMRIVKMILCGRQFLTNTKHITNSWRDLTRMNLTWYLVTTGKSTRSISGSLNSLNIWNR